MSSLPFGSASELSAVVRDGTVRSRDMLEFYLARVALYNPALNAVVALRADEARAEADAADAARTSGKVLGPLHGVPITVKESFDVRGMATTWGHEKLANNIAATDALAVRRLRAAGAIVFGKTNVPYLLSDWQSYNPIYGTTNNPWDAARSPGGSSGGSAAALAAGLTGLELGSDIGASIRNPSHYCGIYGHKPTYGIAAPNGQAPPGVVSVPDLSVIGPMGRSARDLEIGLNVIAGPDDIDGVGWTLTLPKPRHTVLGGLRVGFLFDATRAPVDEDTQAALHRLADFLTNQGAVVKADAWPNIDRDELWRLYILMLRSATSRNQSSADVKAFAEEIISLPAEQDDYWALTRRAVTMGHREWLLRNEQRHKVRRAWAAYFQDIDVLICPIASTVAVKHDHSEPRHVRQIRLGVGRSMNSIDQLFWAGLATLPYLPATAIPIGLSACGLPIGAQIVGPQYGDFSTIEIAKLIERDYYDFTPPPAFLV